jgi:hypothetical protein
MSAAASRPDRLTLAGLSVVAVAAAGTSFTALSGLARLAGWSRDVSPALPIIIDVLAAVSTRAWLSGSAPAAAKQFARRAALFSILLSMLGNVAFHLLSAGWLRPTVVLVMAVAMVPPVGLAAAAHLVAVLRIEPAEQNEAGIPEVPETVIPSMPKTTDAAPTAPDSVELLPVRDGADDPLLPQARQLHERVLAEHGRAAGVARLAGELHVGRARAARLRDALAAATG